MADTSKEQESDFNRTYTHTPTTSTGSEAEGEEDLTTVSGLATHFHIAATDLHPLLGGNANFVYRSTSPHLRCILKHAAEYIASNRTISFPAARIAYEHAVLTALGGRSVGAVNTPTVVLWDAEKKVLGLSDCGVGSRTVKEVLCTAEEVGVGGREERWEGVGNGLGMFLAHLHTWGRTASAATLRTVLEGNRPAVEMWVTVTYNQVELVSAEYAHALSHLPTLPTVLRAAVDSVHEPVGSLTIVHGDFWTGNVLIHGTDMTVVDWEMSKLFSTWGDIGQMAAELFLPFLFLGRGQALSVLDAFVRGYVKHVDEAEGVGEEVARRAVAHFGVHLMVWPRVTGWGAQEGTERQKVLVEECVKTGAEYTVRAWERDWRWVREKGVLGALVKDEWIAE